MCSTSQSMGRFALFAALIFIAGCAPSRRHAQVIKYRETSAAAVAIAPTPPAAALAPAPSAAQPIQPAAASAGESLLLQIYVFDIGQADSMLIIGPGPSFKTLLIDAGEPVGTRQTNHNKIARRIEEITGKKHLDYFVPTHFHTDHIGRSNTGLGALVKTHGFDIGTVIDFGDDGALYTKPTRAVYNEYVANLQNWTSGPNPKVQQRLRPDFGSNQIVLGQGVTVDILAFGGKVTQGDPGALVDLVTSFPQIYTDAPASENDLSLALEITAGEFEMFTAGDMTGAEHQDGRQPPRYTPRTHPGGNRETYTNIESRMVDRWKSDARECDVEVYRVNHHGSAYSSLPDLVDRLDPEFMIYSCGGDHKHPEPAVVKRNASTAYHYVTTQISSESWHPRSSFEEYGEVIGEIAILVNDDGGWYWINDELHRAYTDAEEQGSGPIPGGSGEDFEEEYTLWSDE